MRSQVARICALAAAAWFLFDFPDWLGTMAVMKPPPPGHKKRLSPAAKRALAEAEARRRQGGRDPGRTVEIDGRKGPEPTRYGDWEKDGLASDF